MIRTVTVNLAGGRDTAAAAALLRRLAPQVVCALEGSPSSLRSLVRRADLELVERAGKGRTAVAVLADRRVGVRATDRIRLESPRGVPVRAAVHAILVVGGIRLSVCAFQLGLRPEIRWANVRQLVEMLDAVDAPHVLGADLNDTISSPVGHELTARYQDAFAVSGRGNGDTYPSVMPVARRDLVLVDRRLGVHACGVVRGRLAARIGDHLPVVADLLEGPGAGAPAGAGPDWDVDDADAGDGAVASRGGDDGERWHREDADGRT